MNEVRAKVGDVVVGVDGSSGGSDALRWAVEQAQLTGATVRAVCAWHYSPEVGAFYAPAVVTRDEQEAWARQAVDEAVAPYRHGAVEIVAETVEGPAWHVLVDAAKDAQLLVVGSRGHGALAGVLLGSVSQRCAAHATCPVVIVPSRQPAKTVAEPYGAEPVASR